MRERKNRTRHTRHSIKTPVHILNVAARMFAERGYPAVALKDIVLAAGVNVAAVNYHFGDKRNLYRKVIEQELKERERAAPLDELPQHGVPDEQLRVFIHAMLVQLFGGDATSLMSQLMLREAIDPTSAFPRVVDALPRRQLRILDRIIGRMARPGASRADIRRMSLSVLGQCVYYRYAEKILKRTDPKLRCTKRGLETTAQHIYRFSRAAIKARDW